MWIIPNNYRPFYLSAQATVGSKEDLTLPGLNIESSLMWRSKPSPLRTWSTRWKAGSYLPHLFTRILKPSQRTYFEEQLTSSLEVIRASRLAQQESEEARTTQGTCGRSSGDTLNQSDLLDASLKTSRATYRLDSQQSLQTWKRMVTERRGEYSQRVKLAHRIKGKECLSWRTPAAHEAGINLDRLQTKDGQPPKKGVRLYDKKTGRNAQFGLTQQVKMVEPAQTWATPNVSDYKGPNLSNGKSQSTNSLPTQVVKRDTWPTPAARDWKGGRKPETLKDQGRTPNNSLNDKVNHQEGKVGHLNPAWVEWLMGVPTGWTELDSWETE